MNATKLKLSIFSFATLFFATTGLSQTGKVWTTISSISSLELNNQNGTLTSKNSELNSLFTQLNVNSITKAFPAAKSEALVNVYEISCACDENDLLQGIARKSTLFLNPTLAPTYESLEVPNDYSTVFSNDYALNLINAQGAWDITRGDTSVVIAISDANYHLGHEELVGKYNYVTPNSNTDYSHGTAVATTAAGNTNNYLGKSSIGYNSRLQLRAMNYNELLEATYSGARIVNVSWTSGCYTNSYAQAIVDEVFANGTVIVASAGNGSTCGGSSNLVYPAALNHVISVSSVGPNDNHERYIGNPASTHQHNATVDICAPGYDVALTIAPGNYLTGNGTSFAAPYVSGTIALMLAVNSCLTPEEIEFILKETAVNIDDLNPAYAGRLGAGRMDAAAAVLMASTFNKLNITSSKAVDCVDYSQSVSLTVDGGVAPYTTVWSNEQVGMTLNNASAGIVYTAIVKDSTGCVGSFSTQFDVLLPMTYTSDIESVKCFGTNTGAIDLEVNGGSTNYTYVWNNGETSQDISSIATGTYNVTVTDGNGCVLTETFDITSPSALVSSVNHVNGAFNQTTSIDVTVNGGAFPYSYSWNNGATTEDLVNIPAGFYEVEIVDANGCVSSENATITGAVLVGLDNLLDKEININASSAISTSTAGIEEMNQESVNVYPNPAANGRTTITWENMDVTTIVVYDVTGKMYKSMDQVQNAQQVELNEMASGHYFIHLMTANGDKLVKKVSFI
jgi:hypothetical protein